MSSSPIDRRQMLRGAIALAAVACPLCRSTGALADEWGYTGAHGATHWAKLDPANATCSGGTMQTPIDLTGSTLGTHDSIRRNYPSMPLKIVNNGHTIQVNAAPGGTCSIDGESFDLLQFHFHHPSEHLLSGKAKQLEAHFVHRNAAGRLAVLGVFLETGGTPLAALDPIWAAMPRTAGPEREVPGAMISPASLFPTNQRHYRYQGSLTTPPCSEGVLWAVYRQPLAISRAQVVQFAQIFPVNARPVQALNKRSLLLTD